MSLKNLMTLVPSLSLVDGVVWASGCTNPVPETQFIENITSQEAFALIQSNKSNPDFVIIDMRTPEEFADEHIENAIVVNYRSETFRNELDKLDKNKTYLIYCRTGNRTGKALAIMEELRFTKVYHLSSRITEWKAEGLPTIK